MSNQDKSSHWGIDEENGYLLVEDVVTTEQLQCMQEITHEFIDRSRHVTKGNDVQHGLSLQGLDE